MTFNSNANNANRAMRHRMVNRLTRAGLVLRNEHRKDLNEPYPPASVPGEFPARRTGRLRDGVQLEVDVPNLTAKISSTTPYVLPLARRGRLTILNTLHDKVWNQITMILTGP